ncbi:MAG: hypothetical protein WCO75_05370, partial [Planctomycetota bacterium]
MAKLASVSRLLQRAGANLQAFDGIDAGKRFDDHGHDHGHGPASRALAMLLLAALVTLGGC